MALVRHGRLTPGVVAVVTVNAAVSAAEVMNVDGIGDLYFTVSGVDPVVDDNDVELVPAIAGTALSVELDPDAAPPFEVKLLSPAATKYSVRAV